MISVGKLSIDVESGGLGRSLKDGLMYEPLLLLPRRILLRLQNVMFGLCQNVV